MVDTAERRASPRYHVQGRASVLLREARSFHAGIVDISEGGVCLTSPIELTPGTWCYLRIALESAPAENIAVSGSVCFCIGHQGQYRVGVHCLEAASLISAVRRQGG